MTMIRSQRDYTKIQINYNAVCARRFQLMTAWSG